MSARIHYAGPFADLVDMECPSCSKQTPVAIRPDPYFITHPIAVGEECPSSRTWVSRRSVEARVAELEAAS